MLDCFSGLEKMDFDICFDVCGAFLCFSTLDSSSQINEMSLFSLVGISAHIEFVLDLFEENSRACAT